MTEHNVAHLAEPPTQNTAPQVVSISVGAAESGRFPVVVTIVPIVDLDATGIFVDLRRTSKDPLDLPTVIEVTDTESGAVGALSAVKAGHERRRGDDAVEALAKEEAGDEATTHAGVSEDEVAEPASEVSATPRGNNLKRGWLSSQIARSVKLTVGQAESFRAEIATPPAAGDGEFWYARGRIAAAKGQGIRSGWQRLA